MTAPNFSIAALLLRMEEYVRETSDALGKKIVLKIISDPIELEKNVFNSLTDPLIHLLRNAIDHGIESPENRLSQGKSEIGTITIVVKKTVGRIELTIEDDGRGIDTERLRKRAIELGLFSVDHPLTELEYRNLIFIPGLSTKERPTTLSGRGVGMDIVQSKIQSLQGEIEIKTQWGHGTTFKISLPF